jgi:hypothetical protein
MSSLQLPNGVVVALAAGIVIHYYQYEYDPQKNLFPAKILTNFFFYYLLLFLLFILHYNCHVTLCSVILGC